MSQNFFFGTKKFEHKFELWCLKRTSNTVATKKMHHCSDSNHNAERRAQTPTEQLRIFGISCLLHTTHTHANKEHSHTHGVNFAVTFLRHAVKGQT